MGVRLLCVCGWLGRWVEATWFRWGRALGMEFGVGVGLGMPEFAVQLCFAIPLWQKFLCRWMGVLLLCLWVIG